MKVLIVNNMAPFIWGGAEELAVHLQKNLIIAGHQAEVLRIPFQWEPAARIPSQMLMARAFELWNVDHVIALKFPAYLIRHPEKTIWLLHQYRQAYDLHDAGQTNISTDQAGDELRALIKAADEETFTESRNIFTNSEVTRQRLLHYNGIKAEVLYPPVNDPEIFTNNEIGDYIFAGGRINNMKRQHLLVEALSHTDRAVKLLIAGPPDTPADAEQLKEMVARLGLEDRVKLDLRFLPRATYAKYVNESMAVAYLPFDEDSLGYVAMEAAIAGKALITTTDSGGVLGLAKHEETGWIAEAKPSSLAEVMRTAVKSIPRTRQIGLTAKELWLSLGINWPQTVEALLQ
ncbi:MULTISPECIES: glycosyltransferase family 4 protein [Legionella]|uniref:D-inositol-3-phosphate glycosyltransferase n=1 Tax=Legionella drozanskii LLAP-1 TaxID=1212489 RepID=A0A0W0SN52_9GAMM|nr:MULTISPECIES: glycosyltransferase family 4 protein [Legionella]KTC84734.1 D-inositol-3-phosphate glycosyltransferase [Legionella drozanskii LLAP-1]PJE18480.1 MAG: glycosyl transferase family 1 [Legionella sp.]